MYRSYHERDWVGLPWFRTRDKRLPAKTLVLGVEPEGESGAAAVALEVLQASGPLSFPWGGDRLVAASPGGESAFLFRLPAQLAHEAARWSLRASEHGLMLVEHASGLEWNAQTGEPSHRSPKAPALELLPASPIYWGIWSRFYPETVVLIEEDGSPAQHSDVQGFDAELRR